MRIKSIELIGFKRFALSEHERFYYEPQHRVQLLLGTNGSGKTSLMHELSPMPSLRSDFKPGGSKTIILEKGSSEYILKSTFKTTGSHSFICDGVELNEGGTGQVQKDLVLQHFGITQETHEILIGVRRFCTMSVLERRQWFTRVSNIDFDYAVKMYNSYRNQLKDIESILKYQQSTLLVESSKILDENDLEKLNTDIAFMKEYSEYLIKEREASTGHLRVSDPDNIRLDEILTASGREHRMLLKRLAEIGNTHDPELYPEVLKQEELEEARLQARFKEIGLLIEKNQSTLKTAESLGKEVVDNLYTSQINLEQEIQILSQTLRWFHSESSHEELLQVLDLTYDSLFEVLQNLDTNETKRYSFTHHEELLSRKSVLIEQMSELTNKLAVSVRYKDRMEHLKTHDGISCPKCEHHWLPGYDEQQYLRCLEFIKKTEAEIATQSDKIDQVTKDIEASQRYFELYKSFNRIKVKMTMLAPIWTKVEETKVILSDPKKILDWIDEARYDIPILRNISVLKSKLRDVKEMVYFNEKSSLTGINQLQQQIDEHLVLFTELQSQLFHIDSNIKRIRLRIEIHKRLNKLQDTIALALDKKHDITLYEIARLRYVKLQDLIREVQVMLGNMEQRKIASVTQTSLVDQLKSQIQASLIKKDMLTAMVAEMSPKDGLIAKSMTGFINTFVQQMNAVIAKIWNYPFELLPINDDDEAIDLNYRFEVIVMDREKIPDITKCSAGMQEIIDLAFKLISMNYLQISTMPIYLDEFGKSMDHIHRSMAFDMVMQSMTYANYTQIFMVSHYDAAYGGLANADVVVLDSQNVVIPPGMEVNTVVQWSD